MFKRSVLISSIALLSACGGGSSSGGNDAAERFTVSVNTTGLAYAAWREADGDWQKLDDSTTTTRTFDAGTQLSLVTVCDESGEDYRIAAGPSYSYDVNVSEYRLAEDLSLDAGYCLAYNPEQPEVTFTSADAGIEILDLELSESLEDSSDDATLSNSTAPRTLIALGYREADGQAFFYKRTGLELSDGDELTIDFTDTTYAAAADYADDVTNPAGFSYSLYYVVPDSGLKLDLEVYDEESFITVPQSMRTSGDLFIVNWQFGDDSNFNRYVAEPSDALELSSAPDELSLDAVTFAQDNVTGTITFPAWDFDGLSLSLLELDTDMYDSATYTWVYVSYSWYSPSASTSFSFELLDLNTLPDFPLTLPETDGDDVDFWGAEFDNGQRSSVGARVLNLNSLDPVY